MLQSRKGVLVFYSSWCSTVLVDLHMGDKSSNLVRFVVHWYFPTSRSQIKSRKAKVTRQVVQALANTQNWKTILFQQIVYYSQHKTSHRPIFCDFFAYQNDGDTRP
ncbi:unnamed protein product [Clavelina lepadiformis]|uniref:Uncharacterized protein n=1 Tax=Clavelina lepadiformis TaxID=159417 RepID=A0ABP0F1D4_CLALP